MNGTLKGAYEALETIEARKAAGLPLFEQSQIPPNSAFRALRRRLNLTIEEFAKHFEVTEEQVRSWEMED